MKLVKRTTTLVLIVALLVTIFAIPASAVNNATLRSKMTKLPYLYHGVVNGEAVRALQRFLIKDPDNTYGSNLYRDGLDGGFGPTVEAAVRQFQVNNGIYGPNGNGTGEVYTTTWGVIADKLTESGSWLRNSSRDNIYYYTIGSQYNFSYYNNETGNTTRFASVS